MSSQWDADAIGYDDTKTLSDALVGRSVVATRSEGSGYHQVISFILDDGSTLKAHAADGGCACSNGCFTVDNPDDVIGATILGVEVQEVAQAYDYEAGDYVEKSVAPRSIRDGSATIRLFVYTELGKKTLVESEGGDNGYYGWGYHLTVDKKEG